VTAPTTRAPRKRATAATPAPAPGHIHRWAIEPADGPTSKGRCHGCGAERVFRNSLDVDYGSNLCSVRCDICHEPFMNMGSYKTHRALGHGKDGAK